LKEELSARAREDLNIEDLDLAGDYP